MLRFNIVLYAVFILPFTFAMHLEIGKFRMPATAGIHSTSDQLRPHDYPSDSRFPLRNMTLNGIDPEDGYTENISSGGSYAWPLAIVESGCKKMFARQVRYCFVDALSHNQLQQPVKMAIAKWSEVIGDPEESTGHCLSFRNVGKPYCYIGYQNENQKGQWNPEVSPDAVAIRLHRSAPGHYSTIGYNYPEDGAGDQPGHHYMTLMTEDDIPGIAHEVQLPKLHLVCRKLMNLARSYPRIASRYVEPAK